MTAEPKTAILGGLIGAAVAVTVVFGAALSGLFPRPSDVQLHDYLLKHPVVLIEMQNRLEELANENAEQQTQNAVDKLGLARFFDPKLAFVTGPAGAKKSVVELFDYNCPHCRNIAPLMHRFYDAHKADTRFAFVELPIFGGPSINAARTALAARRQGDKYVAFHFALMSGNRVTHEAEIAAAAKKAGLDLERLNREQHDPGIDPMLIAAGELAQRIHSSGTPLFIVNGKVHSGELSEAELNALWNG